MPIYEYRCPNGHLFERFQRMSDPAPTACEVCGAAPVELVLYPVAVHYKGSGFYSTDYGKGGKRKEAASTDGAGGGDKKPAEKSDSSTSSTTTETKKAAEA